LARATKKLDSRPTWDGPRLDLEVEKLVKAIDKALDKACPKKTITLGVNKSTSKLDWFQPETKKLSIQVKQYALIYRDNQTDINRQRYKLTKKQLQSNIRANKREANQNVNASIKDMKSFSKTTKAIIGSSPPPMGMLKEPQTGAETNSADGVARVLLNKHFPGSINPKPSPNPHHSIKSKVINLDAQELQQPKTCCTTKSSRKHFKKSLHSV
jgi:hypothetical protein